MYKKKFVLIFLYFILYTLYVILPPAVHAEYVLPYPSFMPGSPLYKISTLLDVAKRYWSFGNIAQLKYRMSMADKKLVEAKTLFEYKQYLLATDALQRSDKELSFLLALIDQGSREGKDMNSQKQMFADAMEKHITTLQLMKNQLPVEFQWTPEKANSTTLLIGSMLDASIKLRGRK